VLAALFAGLAFLAVAVLLLGPLHEALARAMRSRDRESPGA